MRLGAGLPRPPEIELSTLPTPSVNGTERLAGSACAGCCYLSAPSRRDVQWAPGDAGAERYLGCFWSRNGYPSPQESPAL